MPQNYLNNFFPFAEIDPFATYYMEEMKFFANISLFDAFLGNFSPSKMIERSSSTIVDSPNMPLRSLKIFKNSAHLGPKSLPIRTSSTYFLVVLLVLAISNSLPMPIEQWPKISRNWQKCVDRQQELCRNGGICIQQEDGDINFCMYAVWNSDARTDVKKLKAVKKGH